MINSISASYQWAINACNADNVGYSQDYRTQQTVNGITYYDCSSFIWYALLAGGFDCVSANDGSSYPFTTYTMGAVLERLGFVKVPVTEPWQAGDILVVRSSTVNHTEMVYQGRITMGAHSYKYPLRDQVAINSYETSTDYYQYCYRYGAGATALGWVAYNGYLNTNEMKNNAYIIYTYLHQKGWSLNAICGMLGNMQAESSINPAIWEGLSINLDKGFGLVQWTPATNYIDWATANGYSYTDGLGQLVWIDEETVSKGQWIATTLYPMSFAEFKVSKAMPEYLASVFLKNFKRASIEAESTRQSYAREWYNYLKDLNPYVDPVNTRSRKMPLWMMCRPVYY